jgi:hypothetical protein
VRFKQNKEGNLHMKSHDKYIERSDLLDATHLELSVYYNKGGANYFNGGVDPRGYYLCVKPVRKGNGMIRYTMFTGLSRFLFETKRFSAKQFERAVDMAKGFEDELIAAVVEKNKAA